MSDTHEIEPFYPVPTAQVEAFVDAIGVEATIIFLLHFGGAELYISLNPQGRGMVESPIGHENTARLAQQRDRMQARVPLANKWLAQCLDAQGMGVNAIARRLRKSDKTVRSYLKGRNAGGGYGKR